MKTVTIPELDELLDRPSPRMQWTPEMDAVILRYYAPLAMRYQTEALAPVLSRMAGYRVTVGAIRQRANRLGCSGSPWKKKGEEAGDDNQNSEVGRQEDC